MSEELQQENVDEDTNEKVVVKRNIKDCVFTDLFGNKKYLRELYLVLHPEDTDVTEDNLTDITIENVLVNDLYQTKGITVVKGIFPGCNRHCIGCECQNDLWRQ